MITAGIDAGAKTVKAVIVRDGEIAGMHLRAAGADTESAAGEVLDFALQGAGLARKDIEKAVATGAGRKLVPYVSENVTEIAAAAAGARAHFPGARMVVDVGAEEARVVKLDGTGRIVDFALNDRCAAGTGAFVEAMARALGTTVEDLGPLSLKPDRTDAKSGMAAAISSQCAVFAESEVVALLHARTPPEDIARAVHDAICAKIASMIQRLGVDGDIVLAGGVARNIGIVETLKNSLERTILVPDMPECIGACGAAVLAAKK